MKVLVTGDSGYIGRQLASSLKKKGFEVVGLDMRHDKPGYETIDFNLTKPGFPRVSNISAIFHLAADTECSDAERAFNINVKGTEKMLDLAKKNNAVFIYASTGGVYGFGSRPFKETDKTKPDNAYTKTKVQAEEMCKKYSYHFPVTILRYFFPYGAGDDRRLVNRLVKKITTGETVELNIEGRPVINPVAMQDAIDVTIKSMCLQGFNILNIGGKENTSILELVRLIEKETKHKAKIIYNGKKIGDLVGDIAKAKKILGYEPKISLKNGIKELCRNAQ